MTHINMFLKIKLWSHGCACRYYVRAGISITTAESVSIFLDYIEGRKMDISPAERGGEKCIVTPLSSLHITNEILHGSLSRENASVVFFDNWAILSMLVNAVTYICIN